MKSKKFLVFLVIAVIAISAVYVYSALKTARAYTFFAPIENLFGKLASGTKDLIGSEKQNITEKGETILNKSKQNFKNQAFNFTREKIINGVDAVGNFFGAETEGGDASGLNKQLNINCPN